MKSLIVHNRYGKFSGEEAVVEWQIKLLQSRGNDVFEYKRSSEELLSNRFGSVKAFFSGMYNPFARRHVREVLNSCKPDIVHIHNLFPLISPSILSICKQAGVPVVMTVHNYRLVCPNGLHLVRGTICEKCCGGKEWWCILRNCEMNPLKSMGYALRNYMARYFRFYQDNVSVYACLTEFQKARLVAEGFEQERICVIPNTTDLKHEDEFSEGEYVGYIGRVSHEKGIEIFQKAAKLLPDLLFKVAGAGTMSISLANIDRCGHLSRQDVLNFYKHSKFIVLPSICFEGFPNTAVEAMALEKPVIASRIGGIPEIVEEGVTGFLFEPGNAEELAGKIRTLWDNPELCVRMGVAARAKAMREYSPERYYERLMNAYDMAIKLNKAKSV